MPCYCTGQALGLCLEPKAKVTEGGSSPRHWHKLDIVFLTWEENIAGVVQKEQLAGEGLSCCALKLMTSLHERKITLLSGHWPFFLKISCVFHTRVLF